MSIEFIKALGIVSTVPLQYVVASVLLPIVKDAPRRCPLAGEAIGGNTHRSPSDSWLGNPGVQLPYEGILVAQKRHMEPLPQRDSRGP